eukprot:TRINITY_DN13036_c0_g1_i1.p1 TRINITY_DN13036_c0_g1~~TRINITY_DN13036_c0_g1_i1.p1  ORF type:complete len:315 (-),score=57.54 TRINITY_DN13036_c0_g1_i1:50-934(-)
MATAGPAPYVSPASDITDVKMLLRGGDMSDTMFRHALVLLVSVARDDAAFASLDVAQLSAFMRKLFRVSGTPPLARDQADMLFFAIEKQFLASQRPELGRLLSEFPAEQLTSDTAHIATSQYHSTETKLAFALDHLILLQREVATLQQGIATLQQGTATLNARPRPQEYSMNCTPWEQSITAGTTWTPAPAKSPAILTFTTTGPAVVNIACRGHWHVPGWASLNLRIDGQLRGLTNGIHQYGMLHMNTAPFWTAMNLSDTTVVQAGNHTVELMGQGERPGSLHGCSIVVTVQHH